MVIVEAGKEDRVVGVTESHALDCLVWRRVNMSIPHQGKTVEMGVVLRVVGQTIDGTKGQFYFINDNTVFTIL